MTFYLNLFVLIGARRKGERERARKQINNDWRQSSDLRNERDNAMCVCLLRMQWEFLGLGGSAYFVEKNMGHDENALF